MILKRFLQINEELGFWKNDGELEKTYKTCRTFAFIRMSRNAVLQVFKGVGVQIRQLYHARENNWTNYFLVYHASTK